LKRGAAGAVWPAVAADIARATGRSFAVGDARPVTGGCIHRAFAIAGGSSRYFVKTNDARYRDAFAAEVGGLDAILAAGIRAPRPVCHGTDGTHAWLVMEFVELGAPPAPARLGAQLAQLHAAHGETYGWSRGNYIGATPQCNRQTSDWTAFWQTERLTPQLELAARNGLGERLVRAGGTLIAALPRILTGHRPPASLLHGDLWSGNVGFLPGGEPVVFDPAVYFGDREADLAMTELFGGFAPPSMTRTATLRRSPTGTNCAGRSTTCTTYSITPTCSAAATCRRPSA
jgi:protein-ribulosamine 3-kinase